LRLEYSAEADRNLEQLRETRPDAEKLIAEFEERVRQIVLFPRSGALAKGWEEVGLRSLVEGNYRIVYAVGAETIVILGIISARRPH
jgi:plasmid stabilization system protein ParE